MLSRLSRNSFWLLIARLCAQLGLALFTVLLARYLGSAVFGEYAFIAALITIGNVLTTFGTDMLIIREIAAADDLSLLSPALLIQLLLSIIFIAAVWLVSDFAVAVPVQASVAMRIYVLSMLPLAFFTVFTTALRGTQRMSAYASLNLFLILLQLASALALLWLRGGLVELAALLLSVQILAAILAGVICQARLPLFQLLPPVDTQKLRLLFRAAAPIALLALLGVLYQRLSLLMLPWLAGPASAGWFSASSRLVEAAKVGHLAVFTALYPQMAQAGARMSSDLSKSFRLPGMLLLAVAALISVALSALAGLLVRLLYGTEYAAAAPVLRILAWTLLPYTVSSFLTLAYLARRRADLVLRGLLASLLTLLVLTLWLVPLAGVSGAAIGFLCAEIIQAIVLAAHYAEHAGQKGLELRKVGPA